MFNHRVFSHFRSHTKNVGAVAFADLIEAGRHDILRTFADRATNEIPGAREWTRSFVEDHVGGVLTEIAKSLRTGERGIFRNPTRLAEAHGRQRAGGVRFSTADIRREYDILDDVIRRRVPAARELTAAAQERYGRILRESLSHATEAFVRNSTSELLHHQATRAKSDVELARAQTERDLAKNLHAWLFEIIDRIPKPVLLLNRDTQSVWFTNDAAKRMLGLNYERERAEALVDGRICATTPDGRALSPDEIPSSRALRGETVRGEEVIIITPSARHHVRVSAEQVDAAYGQPASSVVLIQDISALKATEDDLRRQNGKLIEAERLVAAATEVAKIGFFDWNIEHDAVTVSDQFTRDWGVRDGAPIGEVLSLIFPADRARIEALLRHAAASGERYHAQFRICRATDGATRWIDAQGRATTGDEGVARTLFGATIDITDRKAIESETLAMVNSIPQLAWMGDAAGNLFWYNDRWLEFTGTTLEQMQTLGWAPFHDPHHLDRAAAKWFDHLARGERWEDVFPLRGKDGEYRWFLSRAEPIRDLAGTIVRWFGTNTDVTDQLDTERNLTRLAAVVESSTDFIGMTDERLNPTFLNRSARDMVEFGDRDITKFPLVEFFVPEDRATFEGSVVPILRKNGFWEGELNFRNFVTDAPIPVHYTIFPLRNQRTGEMLGYATVTKNITERKRLEHRLLESRDEAERANTAKSAFLANMSHEIRSPLGAITGFSELLRSGDFTPTEVLEFVAVIDRNSKHVLRIVDDILDLSKVEAGKMLIEHIEFSLPELLADFTSLMGLRAREKGIGLEISFKTSIPQCIFSDPTRLRQVLTNVVGNAIKFTEKGRVRINVAYADGRLDFAVADTGIGLSKLEAGRLFEAFNQADASMTRKFGGTGLGLVLTRALCEAMGGSFDLETSDPGLGSTFVARVAVDVRAGVTMIEDSAMPYSTSAVIAPPKARGLEHLRVLVVEDSPDNQILFQLLLSKAGAHVQIARDGVEGVERARAGTFDIVLMDVQMPRMDGHEAVRLLRGEGYPVPIIALTAHAMIEERERAEASGFSAYVSKPVDRDHLFTKITTLVGRGPANDHG